MKVGKIIFCVVVLPLSVMLSYKANKEICVYSEITLENVEALAGGENGRHNARYAWSREISCDGWFSDSYRVWQENGSGNECYEPGATACDCGVNC